MGGPDPDRAAGGLDQLNAGLHRQVRPTGPTNGADRRGRAAAAQDASLTVDMLKPSTRSGGIDVRVK
jgi:hypothetical protein